MNTTREKVLKLKSQGKTNAEISRTLGIVKGTVTFHVNPTYRKRHITNQKNRRISYKEELMSEMGGKCKCCGYNTCNAALEFHHVDPSQKDPLFKKYSLYRQTSLENARIELKKCILVCANCHREIHANIRTL